MSNNTATRVDGVLTTVQSVDRAITVLEILASAGEAGVTEIAAELGVHKSTAFRLVAALENRGLVEQNSERGKYCLGVGIIRLAGAATARLDLVQESRGITRQLAAETGETVNLAVLSDGAALYVDQVSGSSALQSHNWVGQRIPLHATSNGKVLLSGLPDKEILATAGQLRSFTPSTITSGKRLRAAVTKVREEGYAVAVDELELGLTAVAAPIRNASGDVRASMSLSGPTFRLNRGRVDDVLPTLLAAALQVSQRLGWREA
ncbi:MAG: IclR family transcriptional regulator [Actinomycetota bacterium]|nr:IclR family transcriptional regulator [Actinomycetota bacterium]